MREGGIERKKENEIVERKSNTNGVVITVYTESLITRTTRLSKDPTKKTKQGRAFLLAHSRQLRDNAVSQSQTNQSCLQTKCRDIWLTQSVPMYSTPMPPSSSSCRNEGETFKESKERNPNASPFLSKMKNTLKQLSCREI